MINSMVDINNIDKVYIVTQSDQCMLRFSGYRLGMSNRRDVFELKSGSLHLLLCKYPRESISLPPSYGSNSRAEYYTLGWQSLYRRKKWQTTAGKSLPSQS